VDGDGRGGRRDGLRNDRDWGGVDDMGLAGVVEVDLVDDALVDAERGRVGPRPPVSVGGMDIGMTVRSIGIVVGHVGHLRVFLGGVDGDWHRSNLGRGRNGSDGGCGSSSGRVCCAQLVLRHCERVDRLNTLPQFSEGHPVARLKGKEAFQDVVSRVRDGQDGP